MKPECLLSKRGLTWLLPCLILGAGVLRLTRERQPEVPGSPSSVAIPSSLAASAQADAEGRSEVALRPLVVAASTSHHEWTREDATDPKVIECIAHNPDEFVKMVEENDRIKRRQLVYRKETAAKLIQDARLSGEPLKCLTLPGIDGQELQVEILSADLAPSGQSGSFTGQLVGKPKSMVTLAFEFGVEAFTVLSPEDGIYLQADPREPGELIVKSFDPEVYANFRCGNPEHSSR